MLQARDRGVRRGGAHRGRAKASNRGVIDLLGADFWLEWRVATTVARLRQLLPHLAAPAGYRLVELQSLATHSGWAQFAVEAHERSVGVIRAQDESDGGAQLLIAPGADRAEPALEALNRAALALYCGLIARGLLAPPPPLRIPAIPLTQIEE